MSLYCDTLHDVKELDRWLAAEHRLHSGQGRRLRSDIRQGRIKLEQLGWLIDEDHVLGRWMLDATGQASEFELVMLDLDFRVPWQKLFQRMLDCWKRDCTALFVQLHGLLADLPADRLMPGNLQRLKSLLAGSGFAAEKCVWEGSLDLAATSAKPKGGSQLEHGLELDGMDGAIWDMEEHQPSSAGLDRGLKVLEARGARRLLIRSGRNPELGLGKDLESLGYHLDNMECLETLAWRKVKAS